MRSKFRLELDVVLNTDMAPLVIQTARQHCAAEGAADTVDEVGTGSPDTLRRVGVTGGALPPIFVAWASRGPTSTADRVIRLPPVNTSSGTAVTASRTPRFA
jgi:hypothetical protein